MAGARAERVTKLYFVDQTTEGNPTEEGEVRLVSDDLVALLDGVVQSLTGLPAPTAAGAMFYSDDGVTFEQIVPLVGDGILVSDEGKIVYEG